MKWQIVVIVLSTGSAPLEFRSNSFVFETQKLCEGSLVKATEDFIAEAHARGVMKDGLNFTVTCKQQGEPT